MSRQIAKDVFELKSSVWSFSGDYISKSKTTLSSLSITAGVASGALVVALLLTAFGLPILGAVIFWITTALFTFSLVHDVFAFRRMYKEIDLFNGGMLACRTAEMILTDKISGPSRVSMGEVRTILSTASDADVIWPSCLYILLDHLSEKRGFF